jgi:hypothetical protein
MTVTSGTPSQAGVAQPAVKHSIKFKKLGLQAYKNNNLLAQA